MSDRFYAELHRDLADISRSLSRGDDPWPDRWPVEQLAQAVALLAERMEKNERAAISSRPGGRT